VTCSRFAGPIFALKFQFSGMTDSGRWTGKHHEEIDNWAGVFLYIHSGVAGMGPLHSLDASIHAIET